MPRRREPQPLGTLEYKFNFTAPSAHIKQSLATVSRTPANARDFQGAINVVNDDGKERVEGLQLAPPPIVFTLAYSSLPGVITDSYQKRVEKLVGKVNSADYRGRLAGDLLLAQVAGGKSADDTWNIEFGFSYIERQTNIPVGSITVPAKDGHDLLWVYYSPEKDDNAKALVSRPLAAYVERVWYRADFGHPVTGLQLPA